MSEKNPDLLSVSRQLNAAKRQIDARKEATEDMDEFRRLNAESREISQRIQAVNGLIFCQRSDQIADAARQVEAAQEELSKAIKDMEQINNVINSVTALVGLADRVIAIASKGTLA